jgi:DNA-binding transcriptional ArsR family regulator
MKPVLEAFKALADPSRLRLLALCARGELTVTELTEVLGQSQPRVSRHLKVLCGAGLLDRFREQNWVYYRVPLGGPGAEVARALLRLVPTSDPALRLDRERLDRVLARSNLHAAGLDHLSVRQGNMYQLRFADASFDTVTIDQVLYQAEQPDEVLREAARVLRPGGRLLLVEYLTAEGGAQGSSGAALPLDQDRLATSCARAGLRQEVVEQLPASPWPLLVSIVRRPGAQRVAAA